MSIAQYKGLTISLRDQDDFDLRELLEILKEHVVNSRWKLSGVDSPSPAADELHSISDEGMEISGSKLLSLMKPIYQVLDGRFHGTNTSSLFEWDIWVIRGDEIDVVTDNREILNCVRKNCSDVTELDGS